MFLRKTKKGQSILEYTLLLGIVVAGILIMQHFVKRGFQGGLKDSADKMGDQFSGSGTSTYRSVTLTSDKTIAEETATTTGATGIGAFVDDLEGTFDKGVYVYNNSSGGDADVESKSTTSSAADEKYVISDYTTNAATDFTSSNIDF